jgi:hypothetical protein
MSINIRLIATEVGDMLKYDTTLNEIDRYGRALFRFEPDTFPNSAISSQRAKRIYDWVLTLGRQEMSPEHRAEILRAFCHKLAHGEPELCQRLDNSLIGGGMVLPGASTSSASGANTIAPQVIIAKERAEFRRQLERLLLMFDGMATSSNDSQGRGYLLQELLNQAFLLHNVPVFRSFTRNDGGEQIDGAFKLEGWHYLVECRWRKKLADIRELDGLSGQLNRSGKQTMGLFLSINGWSDNVVPLLKQSPQKSIILMEGSDLRCALTGTPSLPDLILAKAAKLSLEGEPYYRASDYLRDQGI